MHKEVADADEYEAVVGESAVLSLPNEREAEGSFVERGTEGNLNTGADSAAVCIIGGAGC